MSKYTLGLDIGSNSIGWALLDTGKSPKIIDLGVRVFPEGVDRDTKGAELSKNATRREARGARRNRWRRAYRKDKLVRMLQREGLLPREFDLIQKLMETNPYLLRAKGLDEQLGLHDFGRVLFHINQRRGFKSNRKTGKASDNNKVAKEAGQLQEAIDNTGCRTLGEYYANLNPEKNRIRSQYTFRSMYEKEFDLLWAKQSEFYPEILTEQLKEEIKDKTVFYQRPLKPTDDLIGECDLEEGEKRCPRGDWYARKFRLLQDVNNLKIHHSDGSEDPLTDEQRAIVLEQLKKSKAVKFSSLRKKLGLLETDEFNMEYEVNEKGKKKDKIQGDEFNASMQKNIFGLKRWGEMAEGEKIRLNEWLVDLEDDELIEKLASEYGFSDEQTEKVLKISLPSRYMSFSQKAIKKLLPLMEEGKRTDEALDKIYPDRNQKKQVEAERLGLPEDLRNPLVNKALFEVRKVVNAVIREYGKPAKIAIEMARDLKGSLRERKEIHFKQKENERENKRVRERLKNDFNHVSLNRDNIIKYKLWEECNGLCPYTGKKIPQYALFGENPEFQIEHILPYSRSLDDSYMNKTLCEVHENISVKGNQTPYEAYHHDEEKYEQIKQRIKVLPWPKRRKFLQKEIELDEAITRELNDTRYICREAVRYLKQICSNVKGTRGKITSELRHQWGLNSILNLTDPNMKNRDDHRHHAIDAAVVAVTRNKHLRELAESKYAKTGSGVKFEAPWKDFREELAEKIKHINVSHRVTRKVSGQLHEETAYGPTGLKDDKGQDIFVYRKKLEDFTMPMVGRIVDPVVKEIVVDRLKKHGLNPEKKQTIPKEVWREPLYMKSKTGNGPRIKKVRIRDVFNNMIMLKDQNGKPYRAVAPGNNHHIEIFEYKDKDGNIKRDSKVVSMFEAVRRRRKGEPVIQRDHGEGKKFICSLSTNEMVMMPDKEGNNDLFRVQKMSINKQIYFRHHTAATIDNEETLIRKQANLFNGKKVAVDPIGRVFPAND